MKTTTTSALVLAAATLFSAGLAFADDKPAQTEAMVKCSGVNACKGQGGCKSATNSCKGQNGCKGQGLVQMSSKDCAAKGGKEAK